MIDNKGEYLLCSAVHYDNGVEYIHQPKNIKTGLVFCGRRHHNCIALYAQSKIADQVEFEQETQGFLTNLDRFVDRKEGAEIALKAGQIEKPVKNLFSEDLY